MKTLALVTSLLGFSLCTQEAHAKTFTYDFAMPAFQQWEDVPGQSLVGRTSILRLQFDNGNASNRDQTYGLSNIRAAQILAVQGTNLSTDLLGIQFPGFGSARTWGGRSLHLFHHHQRQQRIPLRRT